MGRVRARSGAFLGVLVSGALVTGTLSGPPPANATCFSAFGLSNGNGCTSNLTTIAIAIGPGAVADAGASLFGGAFAFGTNAKVASALSLFTMAVASGDGATSNTLLSLLGLNVQIGQGTASTTGGLLNLVLGISPAGTAAGATTGAVGVGNLALHIGSGKVQTVGALNIAAANSTGGTGQQTLATGIGNISLQQGPGSTSTLGSLNIAVTVSSDGTSGQSTATGALGTIAMNLLGDAGSTVLVQGLFSAAANILGGANVVVKAIMGAALNVLGTNSLVSVTGPIPDTTLSQAFNYLGNGVTVKAGPGPFAIAGSILQELATVIRTGPGITIGTLVPGAAASSASSKKSAAAVSVAGNNTTAASTASSGRNNNTKTSANTSSGDNNTTSASTATSGGNNTKTSTKAAGGESKRNNKK
jgi:hypothetical protein